MGRYPSATVPAPPPATPDQHSPKDAVLRAVDQKLGEGGSAAANLLLSPIPPLGSNGASSRTDTWRAVCQCGIEDYYERVADRVRSDPLDAKTSRHTGECQFASETDAAVLRVVLKVRDGAGGGYWWVECGSCDAGWQVTHYAESVG